MVDSSVNSDRSDTHQKALAINLDPRIYGTIAEIGAGQEVASWFFRVGGAAGTVAKTISAYDMKVSDEIYGKAGRYVSRERVVAMVAKEFGLLERRLADTRPDGCFFAFADSVAARNFAGSNECHGWLALRFQARPGGQPNDIVLHVNLRDQTNIRQQQALGVLGVNLIHASAHTRSALDGLVGSLIDGLALNRIEIDLLYLDGPDLPAATGSEIGLQLVRRGLAHAVCVAPNGTLEAPTEVIRKRPVAIERGLFKDPRYIDPKILRAGIASLAARLPEQAPEPLGLMELSVNNLREANEVSDAEYLRRLETLLGSGHRVLLTRLRESYSLTEYLRRYSQEPMCYNTGISTLALMFAEGYYTELSGGLLEATGKLLANNVKLYAHAMSAADFNRHLDTAGAAASHICRPESGQVTTDTLVMESPIATLYRYLLEAGWIEGVD